MDSDQLEGSIVIKGEIGETALNNWFKNQNLIYIALNQSQETFARVLEGKAKRPDYLLLIQGIGLIAVDAKNHTLVNGTYTINLDKELNLGLKFEQLFGLSLWYAYYDSDESWYWINRAKAMSVGKQRTNEHTNESFLVIDRSEFEHITTAQDLGKLFMHTL